MTPRQKNGQVQQQGGAEPRPEGVAPLLRRGGPLRFPPEHGFDINSSCATPASECALEAPGRRVPLEAAENGQHRGQLAHSAAFTSRPKREASR